jgi:hypothetical protein
VIENGRAVRTRTSRSKGTEQMYLQRRVIIRVEVTAFGRGSAPSVSELARVMEADDLMTGRPIRPTAPPSSSAKVVLPTPSTPSTATRKMCFRL